MLVPVLYMFRQLDRAFSNIIPGVGAADIEVMHVCDVGRFHSRVFNAEDSLDTACGRLDHEGNECHILKRNSRKFFILPLLVLPCRLVFVSCVPASLFDVKVCVFGCLCASVCVPHNRKTEECWPCVWKIPLLPWPPHIP